MCFGRERQRRAVVGTAWSEAAGRARVWWVRAWIGEVKGVSVFVLNHLLFKADKMVIGESANNQRSHNLYYI